MKQILITEEQLEKILRDELCHFAATETSNDPEGFLKGAILTLKMVNVGRKVLDRVFRSEEGVNKSDI